MHSSRVPSTLNLITGVALAAALISYATPAPASDWSGSVSTQLRTFPNDPLDSRQADSSTSAAFEPEWFHEWNDDNQRLTFAPFARWDSEDSERTHTDLRKLVWSIVSTRWELRTGINKVFWGVTESNHLVDIINQTDLVDDADGEDKLGQPMINLALIREYGTLDLFVLPRFRERTFPGLHGRPRTHPFVDTDQAQYESADKEQHVDWAVRWAQTADIWDVGLSYFDGTSRDPTFARGTRDGAPVLVPYYSLIEQFGLDVQATIGPWLLKLETIHRNGQGEAFTPLTTGFEYTFTRVMDTAIDIGWVVEYLYNDQGNDAPVPFADDMMMGLRFALNDTQTSEALLGTIVDMSGDGRLWTFEASRRLGSNWKLSADARFNQSIAPDDILYLLRNDDVVQIALAFYF